MFKDSEFYDEAAAASAARTADARCGRTCVPVVLPQVAAIGAVQLDRQRLTGGNQGCICHELVRNLPPQCRTYAPRCRSFCIPYVLDVYGSQRRRAAVLNTN